MGGVSSFAKKEDNNDRNRPRQEIKPIIME
jgi:hypothetical protein